MVHGVDVVTVFEPDELAAGLLAAGSTCFILTNTRSLSEAEAVELNSRIGLMLFVGGRGPLSCSPATSATRPGERSISGAMRSNVHSSPTNSLAVAPSSRACSTSAWCAPASPAPTRP